MQAALDRAGLTQAGYSRMMREDPSGLRKKKAGLIGIDMREALLLRLLAAHPDLVNEAKDIADELAEREAACDDKT